MTESGRLYKHERYDQIIEEQVAISYASKGISIADTDELSPYDRKIILKSIIKIKESEEEAVKKSKGRRSVTNY